jgi:hypothetical protein
MAENTSSTGNDDWKRPVQKRNGSFSESNRRPPRPDPDKPTPPDRTKKRGK